MLQVLSAIVLSLCVAGGAAAQPFSPAQPQGPIPLAHEAPDDAAIAARLRGILAQLDGFEAVEVAVDAGVVTLTGGALDAAARARLDGIVARLEGVAAIEHPVVGGAALIERVLPSIDRFVYRLEQALSVLPLLTLAAAGFVLVWLLGRVVAAIPVWSRLAPNAFIAGIYRQLVQLAFLLAGLVLALDILDATALLGSILGAAGIIGLAIGFAVRDTVENFIASIMLSIRQPFRPFDLVEIDGDVGKVVRLTSRATVLLSLDGNFIRVPNATVFKSRLVNFSRNRERRFTFAIDIDPACDMAALRDNARARLAALPFVLEEPASAVWIDETDGSDVELRFAGWIDQTTTSFERARGEAIRILRAMVQQAGALRPPPVSRVYTVEDPQDAMNRTPAAAHDLAPESIADLGTEDAGALDRMAQAERGAGDREDLLARQAPPE